MSNSISSKKKIDSATIISAVIVACIYVAVFIAEQFIPATSMLFTVLKKGATYALVAVSMNLCNGFTGIFSLGQAGFMLIGAYVYGIFTIPQAARMDVYQYYNGGLVQFTLPWFIAMILGGLAAAFFAFLIGMPVLRLKSDYLAIATLGFAEIIRAVFQWDKLGPVTNGSNMLRKYPSFTTLMFPFVVAAICIALIVLLINSSYGRAFKSIRDDEIASEAMGISLSKHKMLSFVILGICVSVAGIIGTSRMGQVSHKTLLIDIEMDAILAVAIGGNALGGGRFRMSGSILGAYIIQMLTTTLLAMRVDPVNIKAYKAIVIIIIVIAGSPVIKQKLTHWWNVVRLRIAGGQKARG